MTHVADEASDHGDEEAAVVLEHAVRLGERLSPFRDVIDAGDEADRIEAPVWEWQPRSVRDDPAIGTPVHGIDADALRAAGPLGLAIEMDQHIVAGADVEQAAAQFRQDDGHALGAN